MDQIKKNYKAILVFVLFLAMVGVHKKVVEWNTNSIEAQIITMCHLFGAFGINGQDYVCYPKQLIKDSI